MWQIFFFLIVDYDGDSVQQWFYQLAMELPGFVPNFDGSFCIPIVGKPMFLVLSRFEWSKWSIHGLEKLRIGCTVYTPLR
jgi:hypothetical protein